jgi:hypothetical protein
MSELKNEIVNILEGAKDPSLLTKLKGAILKFTENVVAPVVAAPVAPVVEPIKLAANTAKLKDGTNVSYEGELASGIVLNVVAEDGTMSVAPDGTHELEDGTMVVVANGLVESVTPKAAELVVEAMAAPVAQAFSAMELKFAAEKKENETLKAELSEVKEVLKNTLLAFQTIIEAPVQSSSVTKVKEWSEMSALEQRRYLKSIGR